MSNNGQGLMIRRPRAFDPNYISFGPIYDAFTPGTIIQGCRICRLDDTHGMLFTAHRTLSVYTVEIQGFEIIDDTILFSPRLTNTGKYANVGRFAAVGVNANRGLYFTGEGATFVLVNWDTNLSNAPTNVSSITAGDVFNNVESSLEKISENTFLYTGVPGYLESAIITIDGDTITSNTAAISSTTGTSGQSRVIPESTSKFFNALFGATDYALFGNISGTTPSFDSGTALTATSDNFIRAACLSSNVAVVTTGIADRVYAIDISGASPSEMFSSTEFKGASVLGVCGFTIQRITDTKFLIVVRNTSYEHRIYILEWNGSTIDLIDNDHYAPLANLGFYDVLRFSDNVYVFGGVYGPTSLTTSFASVVKLVNSTTLYTNLYGSGPRDGFITVSNSSGLFASGNPQQLFDNHYSAGNTKFANLATSGQWIKFELPESRIVDQIKWYQSNSLLTTGQGLWKLQGSNNDVDWVDCGHQFTLGTDKSTIHKTPNTTPYTYYRLLGISGTLSTSILLYEVELGISGAPPVPTSTDYANTYGSGDRTSVCTITPSAGLLVGTASVLINGTTTHTPDVYFNTVSTSGHYLTYQLPEARVIDGVKLYQSTGEYAQGVWRIRGSNNGSDWDVLSSDFSLGAATVDEVLFTNTTSYSYYQLYGVSGTTSNGPYLYEFEFKISAS